LFVLWLSLSLCFTLNAFQVFNSTKEDFFLFYVFSNVSYFMITCCHYYAWHWMHFKQNRKASISSDFFIVFEKFIDWSCNYASHWIPFQTKEYVFCIWTYYD
jgi:hypothetical protein